MRLETPSWWYDSEISPIASALQPISWIWGAIAGARMSNPSRYHSRLPVLCVGNFTMGGAGKTPTAIFIAEYLKSMGEQPAFLSRGYGGRLKGPHLVDIEHDNAAMVGDEPRLLARHAPTVVSRDRVEGAKMLEAGQASAIIMDDGFQNTALHKDLALVVIDGDIGIGNGMVAPAGPLRAPLDQQITIADAMIVLTGKKPDHDGLSDLRKSFSGPVMSAKIAPDDDVTWLRSARIIAFAGIGRPDKFFQTVSRIAPDLIGTMTYPDHHKFTASDARDLMARAFAEDAVLLTTEKDWMRLPNDNPVLNELKENARILPIKLEFDGSDENQLGKLIDIALSTRQHH